MLLRSALAVVVTLVLTQASAGTEPVRITFPSGIKVGECQVEYLLAGQFGGYATFATREIDRPEYRIPTWYKGLAVKSLSAFLSCRGYQTETIVVDSVPDLANRNILLPLKPLGTLTFSGQVRGSLRSMGANPRVEVSLVAYWVCGFFNTPDCLLPKWVVASAPIDSGGKFTVALPDFANDAVVNSFKWRGSGYLEFSVWDPSRDNVVRLTQAKDTISGMPLSGSYPGVHVFEIRRP